MQNVSFPTGFSCPAPLAGLRRTPGGDCQSAPRHPVSMPVAALPRVVMHPRLVELLFWGFGRCRITDRDHAERQNAFGQTDIAPDGLHSLCIGIGRRPYPAQTERVGRQQDILGSGRTVQIPIRGACRTSADDHGAGRRRQHFGIRQRCGQRIENRPPVHDDELPRTSIPSRRRGHPGTQQQFDLLRFDAPLLICTHARTRKNVL